MTARLRQHRPWDIRKLQTVIVALLLSSQVSAGTVKRGNPDDDASALIAAANEAIAKQDLTKALALANQAVVAVPDLPGPYLTRSRVLYRSGNFAGSLRDIDAAIGRADGDSTLALYRGMTEYRLHDFRAAIADFSTRIAAAPKDARAWRWRGFAHFVIGENARTIEDLTSAVALDGGSPEVFRIRGLAAARLGNLDSAIDDYKRAREGAADRAEIDYLLGNAYAAKGYMMDAERAYGRAGACWGTHCPPPPPRGVGDE